VNEDRNIVLIGPRGSGKTTVGRLLAERLGRPFADTDDLVRAAAGKTVEAIFAEDGEPEFRRLESEAVAGAARLRGAVIAAGGGAVEDPGNVRRLREAGLVIRLTARPVVLYARVTADPASRALRPPLTGLDPLQEMEATVRRREPLYREAAHVSLETSGKTIEQVAAEIEAAVRRLSGKEPAAGL
jgi:shikimate kinase